MGVRGKVIRAIYQNARAVSWLEGMTTLPADIGSPTDILGRLCDGLGIPRALLDEKRLLQSHATIQLHSLARAGLTMW